MPEIPYVVGVDTGPIYCGVTLPAGHSAALLIPEFHSFFQRPMESQDNCQTFRKVLNPIIQLPSSAAHLAGIRRLMADPLWASRRDLMSEKLQATLLREGANPTSNAMSRNR